MNIRLFSYSLLCLLSLSSIAADAEGRPRDNAPGEVPDEFTPERGKLNTNDATPVDPGQYELEAIYSFTHATRDFDDQRSRDKRGLFEQHLPSLAFTLGILKDLDMQLSFSYAHTHDRADDPTEEEAPVRGSAIGDTSARLRYRLLQSKRHKLDVAYIGALTIPTGSRPSANEIGTSQEFWSFQSSLVASKDWGRMTANGELGFSLPLGEKRGAERGILLANLAAGYHVLDWLQPALEVNYRRDFHRGAWGRDVLAGTAELIMPLTPNWRVNVGVQRALTGRNADESTTLTLALKVAW